MDSSEHRLLEAFKRDQSEDAFRSLVERHLNMVYHTALRSTGDATIAEDVSQQVFTILARKASRLKSGFGLGGWLHRVTVYESAKAMRSENRRALKMKEYTERLSLSSVQDKLHDNILPWLDDAIDSLSESDRRVIILRFFDGHHFKDIAALIGKSEDATQKQVSRAVGKIARRLERHGLEVGTASLGSMLLIEGSKAAPPELLGAVAHHSLAGVPSLTVSTNLLHTLTTMTNTKAILGLVAAILVAIPVTLQWRSHENEVKPDTGAGATGVSPPEPLAEVGVAINDSTIANRNATSTLEDDPTIEAKAMDMTRSTGSGLRNAIKQFGLQYGGYSELSRPPLATDDFFVFSDAELMAILLGLNRERNPRGIGFGEWSSGSSNGIVSSPGSPIDGSLVDSWGNPFMISIDGNGDGMIPDPANPEATLKHSILVYSSGPDGDFSTWEISVPARE
ncbi:MAG: sigma-70 family RNA polymerase sigma factor [Verrucomicrobiae bacterium]|nr:sigma-70 family RNA polymerase sigma factor [Verrucomicrobiae bacterium]